ncbi:MAG TPA: glycosyltransferase [Flavobacterium sp.]|nr:glycosyltransferase [Flavobacterium sp.]
MTFAIITHVSHVTEQNRYFAYAPYVREMNVWAKHVDKLLIVAPKSETIKTPIDISYDHNNIDFIEIHKFDVLSIRGIFKAIFRIPKISWQIFVAMKRSDHIHLRCPGNIGLIASLIQILFPNKSKTAKYAGNWDPKSKQPLSYKLQKWILSNTFLTRNMQVLVYGEWEGSSKNIKPFFTASYHESEKLPFHYRDLKSQNKFIFVGALVSGKRPLYAIQLVEFLHRKGFDVVLNLYGEGVEKNCLEDYISQNNLEEIISLKGNQTQETVKDAYENSHFVILPSESEGWPKAIAEGMFWGCVPLATNVSCVPFILDYGNNGVLLNIDLEKDILQIESILKNENLYKSMSQKATEWSQKYTLDVFEKEIKKVLES